VHMFYRPLDDIDEMIKVELEKYEADKKVESTSSTPTGR